MTKGVLLGVLALLEAGGPVAGVCSFPPLRPHAVPTGVPTPGANPRQSRSSGCLGVSVIRQTDASLCVMVCYNLRDVTGGLGRLSSPWPLPGVSCTQLGCRGGEGEEALKTGVRMRASLFRGLLFQHCRAGERAGTGAMSPQGLARGFPVLAGVCMQACGHM